MDKLVLVRSSLVLLSSWLCLPIQAEDPVASALLASNKYTFVTRKQAAEKENYVKISALPSIYPVAGFDGGGGASEGAAFGLPVTQNTVLVKLEPGATLEQFDALLEKYGLKPHEEVPLIVESGIVPLWIADNSKMSEIHSNLPANQRIDYRRVFFEFLNQLEAEPAVQHAAPDSAMGAFAGAAIPDDEVQSEITVDNLRSIFQHKKLNGPVHAGNYGLVLIKGPAAWNFNPVIKAKAGAPVRVSVIDIGFAEHPDLNFRPHANNPIPPDPSEYLYNTHGIHVAGIVAATHGNGKGIDGVCQFCTLEMCNITNPGEIGTALSPKRYFSTILDALSACVFAEPPPKVINASLGFNWKRIRTYDQKPNDDDLEVMNRQKDLVEGILKTARDKGILIVSAAGNDSTSRNKLDCKFGNIINYTALTANPVLENVIVVEAVNRKLNRTMFSNTGGTLSAPGLRVHSLSLRTPFDGTLTHSVNLLDGTSQAAPFVTGVIALISAYNPDLTAKEIREILISSGQKHPQDGPPVINAFEALLRAHPDSLIHLADLNEDGMVDEQDEQLLKQRAMNLENTDKNYWPREDLNGDGVVSLDESKTNPVWISRTNEHKSLSDLGVLLQAKVLAQ